MKNRIPSLLFIALFVNLLFACNSGKQKTETASSTENTNVAVNAGGGQSTVQDDVSQKNIVQVASASPDHSTLVAAVKAADLVNALSNAGPFTVFAPTNAAFDKLPKGTVDDLLKPEKKEALQNILQYHVSVAVFKPESFYDGQVIGQVNGDNVKIRVKDGKVTVNGANIVASIPTSNGIIHVIDAVLLPPSPTASK
jgi:uncharacterized surface protein with fasciclin (FAS1) repeats